MNPNLVNKFVHHFWFDLFIFKFILIFILKKIEFAINFKIYSKYIYFHLYYKNIIIMSFESVGSLSDGITGGKYKR